MLRPKRFKIARRLGPAVFEQTQTERFSLSEARKKNSQGKDKRRKNISAYNLALREKQRVRIYYGLTERQFGNYVAKATAGKGNPVELLYNQLEMRLDNVAYRIGLAPTHRAARQMAAHGHLTVNGKRIAIPSHQVSIGDIVSIRGGSSGSILFTANEEKLRAGTLPGWIEMNEKQGGWKLTGTPDATAIDSAFNFPAVIEYYSR